MKLFELFQQDIEEVSMSPGALQDFAKTPFAQSMTAGFEAELIVPNVQGVGDEYETEPDYDMDERVSGWDDITDFFVGEYNGRRDVQRAIENMQEEFFNDADEAFDEEMMDDVLDYARSAAKDDGLSEEEIDDLFSEADSRQYEKYMDAARDELRGDFYENYFEKWVRRSYPRMSNVAEGFDLTWPHWTSGGGSGEYEVDDVAKNIEKAIGMKVKGSSTYHGTKRGSDFFILEPDSSIDADESENEGGLELVSPPMPLAQTLEYLDKVFEWAKDYGCRTDKSTGFHMGISIPGQTMENVDHLKFTLFLGDEYVLKQFGRESNTYARSMYKRIKSDVQASSPSMKPEAILNTFKGGMNTIAADTIKRLLTSGKDRYVTVNIKENYIEVRSAGGNYLDNVEKIKNTLLRYVRAMGLAADPEAEKQEYAKKLYKLLSSTMEPGEENIIKLFSQYSAGTLSKMELKDFLRVAQTKRTAKKIPDLITVNQPKKDTYAFLVQYIMTGNIKKTLKVYASGRTKAQETAEAYLKQNNIPGSVYQITADINDPTNQTFTPTRAGFGEPRPAFSEPGQSSTRAGSGTYRVYYHPPGATPNSNAMSVEVNANSREEAEDLFRETHPSTYRVLYAIRIIV